MKSWKRRLFCALATSVFAFTGFTCPGQTVRVSDDGSLRARVNDLIDKLGDLGIDVDVEND